MGWPTLRARGRRARSLRRRLTPARLPLVVELCLFAGALAFLLTGERAAYLDWLHPRADTAAAASLLLAFGLFHFFVVGRYVSPAIARRFSPPAYDDRRVLLDLSEAARAATDVEQLYRLVVDTIAGALRAGNVTLFVRDEVSGVYVGRATSTREDVRAPSARGDGHTSPTPAVGEASSSSTAAPELTLDADAFVVRRLRRLEAPLSIGPDDLDTWMRAVESATAEVREARARECETLRRVGSSLLLRIKMKEQLVGVLSLGARGAGREFSETDRGMLTSVAAQLALVIENSKLVGRVVEEERLRRELELAAEVQQRLFPNGAPPSSAFELAGYCQPARGVGGDYYDFLVFDGGSYGVTVADVSGKGMSAAILMSTVQASLRTQAAGGRIQTRAEGSVAALVSALNLLLCRSTGPSSYVTFFYMQVDERTRQMSYVNAGHNPPLLIRAASEEHAGGGETLADGGKALCEKLRTGGPVIGLFENLTYEEGRLQLRSGDLVVAYTDGLTESLNVIEQEFGEAELCELLTDASADLSADEILSEVVRRVRVWSAGAPQHDDLTLVVLKVK